MTLLASLFQGSGSRAGHRRAQLTSSRAGGLGYATVRGHSQPTVNTRGPTNMSLKRSAITLLSYQKSCYTLLCRSLMAEQMNTSVLYPDRLPTEMSANSCDKADAYTLTPSDHTYAARRNAGILSGSLDRTPPSIARKCHGPSPLIGLPTEPYVYAPYICHTSSLPGRYFSPAESLKKLLAVLCVRSSYCQDREG